jgi:hypothetical protein
MDPSGMYVFLKTAHTTPENVNIVAIGYKYNSWKVVCFIMSKDAGSAALGHRPYITKCPNKKFRNIQKQKVDHPNSISSYFEDSHAIDSQNHGHLFLLGSERHRRTPNPSFYLACTCASITVVGFWKEVLYHVLRNLLIEWLGIESAIHLERR